MIWDFLAFMGGMGVIILAMLFSVFWIMERFE